eukprot:6467267-Amphidinium_carterae.2
MTTHNMRNAPMFSASLHGTCSYMIWSNFQQYFGFEASHVLHTPQIYAYSKTTIWWNAEHRELVCRLLCGLPFIRPTFPKKKVDAPVTLSK